MRQLKQLYSLIYAIYNEICSGIPTSSELNESMAILMQHGRNQVWQRVFEQHLQDQAKKYVIVHAKEEDQEADVRDKSILVIGLVRNIENNITQTKNLIAGLRKHFKKVCFYFYHNNSSDNSEAILKEWIAADALVYGTFAPSTTVTVFNQGTGTIGNRIPMFARMRNQNIKDAIDHFGSDFDYLCMANTDLVQDIDVTGILRSLSLGEPWAIICGNCCFQKSAIHYDAFALRMMDDPINIRELYKDFDAYYGRNSLWLNKLHIFDGWAKVKSGFGDMCIIKMPDLLSLINASDGEVCKVDENDPSTCELISMCQRMGGDIWVSPHIVYPATVMLESTAVPLCFIPRDAGFFSVFNFFIGTVMTGARVYPYYNQKAFLNINKENKHFCYWGSDSENSWFEWFEPVSYYHGDKEHLALEFTQSKKTGGLEAGGEFRNPTIYGKMMESPELFAPWRRCVSGVVKKYIKIKADIITEVDEYWNATPLGSGGPVIGIHYRHPSHFVESGKILLKDYAQAIDAILKEHPDANIFLSTDNELGLMYFSYKYGYRVNILPDISRVDVDNILEWAHAKGDAGAKSDAMDFVDGRGFQLHYTHCEKGSGGSKIGRDIIKEVLCLAKCTWLVHTISNIALATSYFNPDLRMISLTKNA